MSGQVGNLAAGSTGFLGRKYDLAQVKRLLAKARLVTLTGVAGVGKTRLALHVAADLRRAFTGGVWFVELAHVVNADLLVQAVLDALDAHDGTGRDQTTVLVGHLRDRQALVVLDGCEHLLDAVAELADTLLRVAPGLRLLATSRERLDVEGEHLLLEPLRQFGRNRLRAVDEEESLRRKHRDHFVALAERGEREWFGRTQPAVQDRMRQDQANLRVALDHCLGSPDGHLAGLHLVGTLWFYWAGCGALGEGRRWVDRVLALDSGPSRQRAKVLWVGGYLATLQGDLGAAVDMLEECRDYARETGDEPALAYSTHRLGCTMLVGDDLDRAAGLFEEAWERYRGLGLLDSNVLMTRREQEVADLVAGGLSNKDIAVRPVIARRTAEGHVERILQKLGFSSRAQIATWIAERHRVVG